MESSLSLKRSDLAGEVGLFFGFGRGADNGDTAWTTQAAAAIYSCVDSGLRNVYYPSGSEGVPAGYEWSFLKPYATLELAEGESVLALPDDFGGIEGDITVQTPQARSWWPISLVGPGMVYQRTAELSETTGRPCMACLEPIKGTTATQGQRQQIRFWPLADQDYTVQLQYYLLPDALTAAFPYALGGMAHAETILESCLAVAEQRLDDMAGVHTMKFRERLQASVAFDRKLKPQNLGYNGDRSDQRHVGLRGGVYRRDWGQVTVNGVPY